MRHLNFGVARQRNGQFDAYLVVHSNDLSSPAELIEYLDVDGLQNLIDGLTVIKHEIDDLNSKQQEAAAASAAEG